jgi:hypothetical protein
MAPAAATPAILKAVAEAFGPREVVTVPQRPGELAGKRMVIFPEPWAAASWAELLKRACVIEGRGPEGAEQQPRSERSERCGSTNRAIPRKRCGSTERVIPRPSRQDQKRHDWSLSGRPEARRHQSDRGLRTTIER